MHVRYFIAIIHNIIEVGVVSTGSGGVGTSGQLPSTSVVASAPCSNCTRFHVPFVFEPNEQTQLVRE
jgi:hypothetical protein